MSHGINPMLLSEMQFQSFQQQNPQVQQKSIEVYTQNLAEHQRAVKAALFASQPDPHPQSREMLMQHAKNLVAHTDQQSEASRLQTVHRQQGLTSENALIHVFDVDSTRQTAVNVWCQIQSKNLMDLERETKASKDVQSHIKPIQHGGSLETFSDPPEDATSGLPDNMRGDRALRPARDERQYYFEITSPPQPKSGASTKAVNQEGFGVGGASLFKETTPLLELDPETNLTIEGRRQVCILPTDDV